LTASRHFSPIRSSPTTFSSCWGTHHPGGGSLAGGGSLEVRHIGRFVPTHAVVQGADYFDPRGPLRAEWRAGDSIWALVDETRLAEVERILRQLEARGELANYVARHDAMRPHLGQVTFLYGIKT
jgi:hypothetical protein